MSKSVSTQRAMRDIASLVAAISQAHLSLAAQAARAVNVSLTLRNWLVNLAKKSGKRVVVSDMRQNTRLESNQ